MSESLLDKLYDAIEALGSRAAIGLIVTTATVVGGATWAYRDHEQKVQDEHTSFEKSQLEKQYVEAKEQISTLTKELEMEKARSKGLSEQVADLVGQERARQAQPADAAVFQEMQNIKELATDAYIALLSNRYVLKLANEYVKLPEPKDHSIFWNPYKFVGFRFTVTNSATKRSQSQKIVAGTPLLFELDGHTYSVLLGSCKAEPNSANASAGGSDTCVVSWARQ